MKNNVSATKHRPLWLNLKAVVCFLLLVFCIHACFSVHGTKHAHAQASQNKIINIIIAGRVYPLVLTEYKDSKFYFVNEDLKRYGHKQTILEKRQLVVRFYFVNKDVETATNLVFPNLSKQVDKILRQINLPASDAKIWFKPSSESFYIEEESYGYGLSKEKFYTELINNLDKNSFEILPKVLSPKVFADDLEKACFFRGEFSSKFDINNTERKNNIELACKSLNGKMIRPGETFSFNKSTGRRDAKNGYMEANIISGGVFKKGEGGGVCQVSSTMFNAGVLSGLTLVEAHPHSLPVSYVKKGQDAMVNFGTSDLVFKNTTKLPVFLKAEVLNNEIKIKVFGENLKKTSFKIETEFLSEIPEPNARTITPTEAQKQYKEIMEKITALPAQIRKGNKGYKTRTYLLTYDNDVLVKRELIRSDTYKAYGAIIVDTQKKAP